MLKAFFTAVAALATAALIAVLLWMVGDCLIRDIPWYGQTLAVVGGVGLIFLLLFGSLVLVGALHVRLSGTIQVEEERHVQ
jgi:hypothetical protein